MASARPLHLEGRYLVQILLVALVTAGLTGLTSALQFRSGWNAVWLLILPFILGLAFNRDAGRRAFMAMALTIIAFLVTILTGALLGGY